MSPFWVLMGLWRRTRWFLNLCTNFGKPCTNIHQFWWPEFGLQTLFFYQIRSWPECKQWLGGRMLQISSGWQGWGQIRFIKYKYKYIFFRVSNTNTNTNTPVRDNFLTPLYIDPGVNISYDILTPGSIYRNDILTPLTIFWPPPPPPPPPNNV